MSSRQSVTIAIATTNTSGCNRRQRRGALVRPWPRRRSRAAPWLERTDLIAPDFIISEVGNAFWQYIRHGHLELNEATAILQRLPGAFSKLTAINDLIVAALSLAKQYDHPIYDCCYLALAQREGQSLVTLDRDMAKVADKMRISTQLLL